jgi:hypothetical protein
VTTSRRPDRSLRSAGSARPLTGALTRTLLGALVVLTAVLAAGPGPGVAHAAPAGPVDRADLAGQVQDGGGSGGDGRDSPPPTPPTSVTEPDAQVPDEGIIPEPDSGRPPEEAGDRGGALQLAVLGLIVLGVGLIAAQVVRQARRNRDATASPADHPGDRSGTPA